MTASPLLELERVDVRLRSSRRASRRSGDVRALSDVGLAVAPGEIVGVIGETGAGKTTLVRTVMGLIEPTAGSIRFEGREIGGLDRRDRRTLRRRGSMQLVFQDPLLSLDPDHRIGAIVEEGLLIRGDVDAPGRAARVEHALELVGLDPGLVTARPGELSGGQRQRVAIARAIVMDPKLLLCDEPVSALDASNRNRVLQLLRRLRDELGVAIVIISHDLASIAGVVDRVAVLYQGSIVEDGPPGRLFRSPAHPYTALLVASAPKISRARWEFDLSYEQLRAPRANDASSGGCVFASRCRFATDVCTELDPPRTTVGDGWSAACHHVGEWRDRLLVAVR